MSDTLDTAIHARWTTELVAQIPHVEGTRIEIIAGELRVTSALPNWTNELVEQMPHVEGERYEVIAGALLVTSQPHIRHQITCDNIIFELNTWGRQNKLGRALEAPGIIYDYDESVAPDVVWVSRARLDAVMGIDGKLHDSPELVIEVLSHSTAANDRTKKLALYSRHNVQEYWIVDWRAATVEIYRHDDVKLRLVQTLGAGDTLTSPLFTDFACAIDRFFEI